MFGFPEFSILKIFVTKGRNFHSNLESFLYLYLAEHFHIFFILIPNAFQKLIFDWSVAFRVNLWDDFFVVCIAELESSVNDIS